MMEAIFDYLEQNGVDVLTIPEGEDDEDSEIKEEIEEEADLDDPGRSQHRGPGAHVFKGNRKGTSAERG